MNRRYLVSIAALAASSTLALAAPDGSGKPDTAGPTTNSPSASDVAPGQTKPAGQSARDVAPGQMKPDGQSAKEYAPGQTKDDADAKPKSNDRKSDAGEIDRRSGADAASSKSERRAGDTDGSRPRGSIAEVSTEQKTKVRSAFTRHRVEPAKIDLSVSIGVGVPRDVRLYPIPQDIVVIAPAYQEYRYFIVDDRVCIVDPVTYEVVDIIILA